MPAAYTILWSTYCGIRSARGGPSVPKAPKEKKIRPERIRVLGLASERRAAFGQVPLAEPEAADMSSRHLPHR